MIFTSVPKEHVQYIWPQVCDVLEKSVDTSAGKFQMIDILKGILDDLYVLWVVMDDKDGDKIVAAVTTRLIVYPGKLGMAMDWVGGKRMTEWSDLVMKTIMEYARAHECTHIEGYGRKAWGRYLAKYQFNPEYIAYRMELTDG